MRWLHSTCRLSDGIHWMLIKPNGVIYAVSDVGFPTETDALHDIGAWHDD